MRSARISRYSRSTDLARPDAVAAMQLHRRVDHLLRRLGGEELGHRRLAGDPRAHRCPWSRRRGRSAAPLASTSSAMSAICALHHLQIDQRRALHLRAWCTRASASSSARRAKPSAAAATVERNTSSTDIAMLEALAAARRSAPIAAPGSRSNRSRASGCGAITSSRSAISSPGVSRGHDEGREAACAPGASPVRAKTM